MSRHALSLTQRLTLYFTACAAAIVVGLGWVFLQATEQHFVDLDRATLDDKRQLIEAMVRGAESPSDFALRMGEALSHHDGLIVVATGAAGRVLFQTAGTASLFGPPAHAAAASAESDHTAHAGGSDVYAWRHGGRGFRAMRFRAEPGFDPANEISVQVAIDTVHHDHFLRQLRLTLVAYVVMAVAISGLLAGWAAHRGLAPLRAMRVRAAAVSDHQYRERMAVGSVPVEMAALAQELNAMLDRLQADYQRLAEFSSDLAHELRTPISNLLTQTQVALANKRDASTYRNILASNAEEFERMARMVADMLFLAQAERGMALPHPERFSVTREVQALFDFYDAIAEEKGVALSMSGDAEITGDRLMFRRAVSNLLSNAVRHSDAYSPVTVAISQTEQQVWVSVVNAADDIDPTALPRLFDRFFRVNPSRSHPAAEGAGLGLSITQAIVAAHGGHIVASSAYRCFKISMGFPRPTPP